MSPAIPCYTTICEPWNREKIDVLRAQGYLVNVLWEKSSKKVTGSAIRKDIVEGGSKWRTMVPAATARAVDQLDLRNRLLKLTSFDRGHHEPLDEANP
jgi:hypothetical protein